MINEGKAFANTTLCFRPRSMNSATRLVCDMNTVTPIRHAWSSRNSFKSPLYSALDRKGVIVFAAAGNSGLTFGPNHGSGYIYGFPSSYDKVISVASSDVNDKRSSFSNRGDTVDIAAPGDQVGSTVWAKVTII